MTPKPSTASSSKRTAISASKSWNEVRRACIEKFRATRFCTPEKSPIQSTDHYDAQTDSVVTLRHALEQELQRNGVVLESPCYDDAIQNIMSVSQELDEQHDRFTNSFPVARHYITEDELFDLLQVIEDEIERERMQSLEDILDITSNDLYDRITYYEQWEDSPTDDNTTSYPLLCPICHETNLLQTPTGGLACPNHMDGSCSMFFNELNGLSITDLRDRLAHAFEDHGMQCNHKLVFTINNNKLVGHCDFCSAGYTII